jgi:hypothetical protein
MWSCCCCIISRGGTWLSTAAACRWTGGGQLLRLGVPDAQLSLLQTAASHNKSALSMIRSSCRTCAWDWQLW